MRSCSYGIVTCRIAEKMGATLNRFYVHVWQAIKSLRYIGAKIEIPPRLSIPTFRYSKGKLKKYTKYLYFYNNLNINVLSRKMRSFHYFFTTLIILFQQLALNKFVNNHLPESCFTGNIHYFHADDLFSYTI